MKSKGRLAACAPACEISVASTSTVVKKAKALKPSSYQNVSFNRSTGRWQAWTNCMATKLATRGPYVGQYTTEYLAARAQDRSLLKHRALATKVPIKLNFPEEDYASDEKLRNALTDEEFINLLKGEAHACYRKVELTKCMQVFLDEEQARGNLPVKFEGKAEITYGKVMPLRDFLRDTFNKRGAELAQHPLKAPKKQLWKLAAKEEAAMKKMIDDLLCDKDPEFENTDAENRQKPPDADANLLILATVAALTHEDLKPYEV